MSNTFVMGFNFITSGKITQVTNAANDAYDWLELMSSALCKSNAMINELMK